MRKRLLIIILLTLGFNAVKAQILHPVEWSYGYKRLRAGAAIVFMKAKIGEGWHVYSQAVPEGGPVKTNFKFTSGPGYTTVGKTFEPKPVSKYEKAFNMTVSYFEHEVIFRQKLKLTGKVPVTVRGTLEYMTCNDKQCLPPEDIDFSVVIN